MSLLESRTLESPTTIKMEAGNLHVSSPHTLSLIGHKPCLQPPSAQLFTIYKLQKICKPRSFDRECSGFREEGEKMNIVSPKAGTVLMHSVQHLCPKRVPIWKWGRLNMWVFFGNRRYKKIRIVSLGIFASADGSPPQIGENKVRFFVFIFSTFMFLLPLMLL